MQIESGDTPIPSVLTNVYDCFLFSNKGNTATVNRELSISGTGSRAAAGCSNITIVVGLRFGKILTSPQPI